MSAARGEACPSRAMSSLVLAPVAAARVFPVWRRSWGRTPGKPAGHAARRYIEARQQHCDAQRNAEAFDSWRDRRHWRKEAARCADEESTAETNDVATVGPEVNRLDNAITPPEGTARRTRDRLPATYGLVRRPSRGRPPAP